LSKKAKKSCVSDPDPHWTRIQQLSGFEIIYPNADPGFGSCSSIFISFSPNISIFLLFVVDVFLVIVDVLLDIVDVLLIIFDVLLIVVDVLLVVEIVLPVFVVVLVVFVILQVVVVSRKFSNPRKKLRLKIFSYVDLH